MYHELTEAGLDVCMFEQDNVPGGNWHYTEEVPLNAPVLNDLTPINNFVPLFPSVNINLPFSQEFEDDSEIWRKHRGPTLIWESLTCTMPSVRWFVLCKG